MHDDIVMDFCTPHLQNLEVELYPTETHSRTEVGLLHGNVAQSCSRGPPNKLSLEARLN